MKMKLLAAAAVLAGSCIPFLKVAADDTVTLKIERLDPALDAIVPNQPSMKKIATGFTWTEGPIWIKTGYLLFADITSNTIRKVVPGSDPTIWLQPSGYQGTDKYGKEPGSNGMTLDTMGRLTVSGHARRMIYRLETMDPKSKPTVLADAYQGKKLNSPNDLAYRSNGDLYFTDPPYGLRTQGDRDPAKEQPVNGVYRIPAARQHKAGAPPENDKLQLLISDLHRPNGVAFSPDEKYLYVSNTEPKRIWMRYTVKPDGSLTDGKIFCAPDDSDRRPGSPDGIKVDAKGNLYGSGPGGIWIISPEGKHIGTLLMPEPPANLNWGGPDRKTLYITATSSVYSVKLNVAGNPLK